MAEPETVSGIDYLLRKNAEYSAHFVEPGVQLLRRQRRRLHPTSLVSFECMDGRVSMVKITRTPLGIFHPPYRSLGGKFNIGHHSASNSVQEVVRYSMDNLTAFVLMLVTFHYSKGDVHRGCAGYKYDTEAARAGTVQFLDQLRRVYGHTVVYPVMVGIETDEDALNLYGEDGSVLDLTEVEDHSADNLDEELRRLYPEMPKRIRCDFVPLLQGNIAHIAQVRQMNRPVRDVEHCEFAIGVGNGFDWLHETNAAVIVTPFDHRQEQGIETAGGLVLRNVAAREGRSPQTDKSPVLIASAQYKQVGVERAAAVERARYNRDFALEVLRDRVPELVPRLGVLTGIVDMNTRKFQVLEREDRLG